MRLIPSFLSRLIHLSQVIGPCPESVDSVSKQDIHHHFLQWVLVAFVLLAGNAFGEDPAGKANSHETLIRISTKKDGGVTHLYVENVQTADVTVTFEMDLTNLKSSVPFPYTTTLAGHAKVELFKLTPQDPSLGWSWTYTYYSTFGSTSVRHNDAYIYSLPYAPGKAFRVSQGYNGEYSHFGADQYAIDWRMPQGTPIYAAREGVVVGVKNDSNIGGDDSRYDWDANYILIRHSDGTLGQYVHLERGGAAVKVGQYVNVGDFIGLSGNTGHSTGPHLHFSVFKARDGKHRETIPVRYHTADSAAVTLVEGRAYRATGSTVLASTSRENSTTLANSSQGSPAHSDGLGQGGGQ